MSEMLTQEEKEAVLAVLDKYIEHRVVDGELQFRFRDADESTGGDDEQE